MCRLNAQLRLWTSSLLVLISLSGFGCDEPQGDAEDSFGLPGKGDQSCDPRAVLCWGDGDASAARRLMQIEGEVAIGDREPEELFESISALSHKLSDEELAALESLKASPVAEDDEARLALLEGSFNRVYGRVISGYWGAHATLLAEALDSGGETSGEAGAEKADGGAQGIPSALPIPPHLRPAFETLWAQGPFGQYLVTMVSLTGAAKHEVVIRPFQDRSIGEEQPIDLEAEWISKRFARYAALESTMANLSSLIPVVGVWVSVPYGIYGQFKQRMKMTLELMTLYGFDIQDPDDFLLGVQLMTAAQGYQELFSSLIEALVGAQAYRIFAERSDLLFDEEFSERRLDEVKGATLAQFGILGGRLMASVLMKAGQGTTKALLGQITFGITALVDVSLDYINTLMISRELRYALHPWGVALPYETTSWFTSPEHRGCALAALNGLAGANGDVSGYEADFMLESLMRPFFSRSGLEEGATKITPQHRRRDGSWGLYLERDRVLGHFTESMSYEPYGCAAESLADLSDLERLSLLSWLELMAWADLDIDEYEEAYLSYMGEALKFKREEERVYNMMRARVARTRPFVMSWTDMLPTWREPLYSAYEALDMDELQYEVWSLMR